jgi:NTP pyrophosphatase (non-canonical NTP hydrolase)
MMRKEVPLTFEEYQRKSRETAIYPGKGKNFVYPTLGLAGETGETAEIIKKVLRDKKGEITEEIKEKLKRELGDALWYLSNLATELGISLEDIARENIEKLTSRKKI